MKFYWNGLGLAIMCKNVAWLLRSICTCAQRSVYRLKKWLEIFLLKLTRGKYNAKYFLRVLICERPLDITSFGNLWYKFQFTSGRLYWNTFLLHRSTTWQLPGLLIWTVLKTFLSCSKIQTSPRTCCSKVQGEQHSKALDTICPFLYPYRKGHRVSIFHQLNESKVAGKG